MIEANIDDMTGEVAGYVMESLLGEGALDVFYTPIYMKKNRPAIKLSVLCRENQIGQIQKAIFKETTTIGIRMYKTNRVCMNREWITVKTNYGDIRIKIAKYDDIIKHSPEYEDCKLRAQEHQVSVQTVYQAALKGMLGEE